MLILTLTPHSPLVVVEPVKYPCADYKPGDDDLQSFDSRYCKLLHFVLKS